MRGSTRVPEAVATSIKMAMWPTERRTSAAVVEAVEAAEAAVCRVAPAVQEDRVANRSILKR